MRAFFVGGVGCKSKYVHFNPRALLQAQLFFSFSGESSGTSQNFFVYNLPAAPPPVPGKSNLPLLTKI